MPKTKPWTCLASGERAPCDYEQSRLACGWWHDGTERGKFECQRRTSEDGKPAARELWLEAMECENQKREDLADWKAEQVKGIRGG